MLDDPDAAQYVSGIGVHWYWDNIVDAERLNATHHAHPDYFMLGTEACEGHLEWEEEVILGSWERGESYSYSIIEVSDAVTMVTCVYIQSSVPASIMFYELVQ